MLKIQRIFQSPLFLAIFFLIGLGLVQVYSASSIFALENLGSPYAFFFRQSLFCIFGVAVLVAAAHVPLGFLQRWGWALWVLAGVGVLLTLIPGLGIRVGGSVRWLPTPFGVRLEPSEFLKVASILVVASALNLGSASATSERNFVKLPFQLPWWGWFFGLLLPLIALLKQPDFGTFAIILLLSLSLLFAFGLKTRVLVGLLIAGLPVMGFLIWSASYRRARILSFLDPWKDPAQSGFQIIQSMLSFSSGGLFGTGLGQSQGKLFFLPEAHTDFTLAVFGEEWGFWGVVVLFLLYGFIVWKAFSLSLRSQISFDRVTSLGVGLFLGFSVLINAGVVLGLLPTKGLTLPLMSYGGSSLIACCLALGLLVGIELRTPLQEKNK